MEAEHLEACRAVKMALRGDLGLLELLVGLLEASGARGAAYLIVYQAAMNLDPGTARECESCGGACCREGPDVPLYPFDLEDLERGGLAGWEGLVKRVGGLHYLPRPCPLQEGWRCSVHEAKPYACLSYPFACEDLQAAALESREEPPRPAVPSSCPAASRAWGRASLEEARLRRRLRRPPRPMELLHSLIPARRCPIEVRVEPSGGWG